jgi:carboxymuconolactone decarboxylase family protein
MLLIRHAQPHERPFLPALMVALGKPNQLKLRVKGAIANGVTNDEIREVLLHSMIYAGSRPGSKRMRSRPRRSARWEWSDAMTGPARSGLRNRLRLLLRFRLQRTY